ncbi:helix-turn-helix domain-containing protein [Kitasatospora sp. NPDC002227]|uniref:helix-turn-helix domain-containing protein n=1 Tax=Kitasatospora sp. NPDC002227 TaxID=3154773 RepID=UPI00333040C0
MTSPLRTVGALATAAAGLSEIAACVPDSQEPAGLDESVRLAIKALLDGTGESITKLAEAIGLDRPKTSRRLDGKTGWTLSDCERVAVHYEVPAIALFAGPFAAYQLLPEARRRPSTVSERFLIQHYGLALTDFVATYLPPGFPAAADRAAAEAPVQPEPAEAPPVPTAPQAPAAAEPAPDEEAPARPAPVEAAPAVPAPTAPDPGPGPDPVTAPVPDQVSVGVFPDERYLALDLGPDGRPVPAEEAPCLRCGVPTRHRIGGEPRHLGGMCSPTAAGAAAPSPDDRPVKLETIEPPASQSELLGMIHKRVDEEARRHQGEVKPALAALTKDALIDATALFLRSRVGARYEHTAHPPSLEILRKPAQNKPDQIWEARPNWRNEALIATLRAADRRLIERLDINGAYLSALKAHLPIGQLHHNPDGTYDPKHAGLYLITPPVWNHPHLPNPLGNRDEPGPLWITSSTLRLLLRLAGPKMGALCEKPVIHESYTAYASENLLEEFRVVLGRARQDAIDSGDDLTLEYVKDMYSKFVSTMGESAKQRKIHRPDWMHIIRSQAFSNLWIKGHKLHLAGVQLVAMKGTDEIHVIGDWRSVFAEGRKVTEVKKKESDFAVGGE